MSGQLVILALDLADHTLAALPIARRFAKLLGGPLRIVHAANKGLPDAEVLQRLELDANEIGRTVLERRGGDPVAAITSAARDADAALVVMCTHTRRLAEDEVVDGAALTVLRRAPCPVVLVGPERGEKTWALHHVLLPHDGAPSTTAALPRLAELVRLAGAGLTILQVAAPATPGPAESGSFAPHRYIDQPQHEWPRLGDRLSRPPRLVRSR